MNYKNLHKYLTEVGLEVGGVRLRALLRSVGDKTCPTRFSSSWSLHVVTGAGVAMVRGAGVAMVRGVAMVTGALTGPVV